MAKFLRAVAVIAGAVALVATGVGAFAAAGSKLAATAASVAKIATVVGGVAGIGAQILHKPPPARGSVTQVLIAPDAPQPYVMGEGYFAGVMRHDTAYGATLNKIPNPYRFSAVVYSGGGPVQSLTPWYDLEPISSWYSGFLFATTRLGNCPDTALVPQWSGTPGWSSSSKLSGQACGGWSFLFDKDGKRFAAGLSQFGLYGQWVKVYDPRLDSTFPGGSGSCRLGDETTYVWSENPALHAGTYAFGRYQNGKRTFGLGLEREAIDFVAIAAWANTCDINGWTIFGPVFEPGDRWANLRDISLAGGCEPILGAAGLGFHYWTPRVSLDTITADDLAEGAASVVAQTTWRSRLNTIRPKYRSPAHRWEMVQADAISVASLVAEDGEEKAAEWPWNLVKNVDQAAELSRYKIADSRELQPIELPLGPRFRHYRAGDQLDIELWDLMRLETPAVIIRKSFDPATMTTTLTLIGETVAKHAFALGLTGTPPPTPALGQTAQDRDQLAWESRSGRGAYRFVQQTVAFPLTSDDDQIDVAAFSGVIDDGRTLSLPAQSITGLASGTIYAVFYSLSAGTWSAVADPATAAMADPDKVFLAWHATSAGGVFDAPDPPPDGWGGAGGNWGQFPIP